MSPDYGPSGYYNVLLLGGAGVGKTTTANKLLFGKTVITPWTIIMNMGAGLESVATKCKLHSNDHKVRVLDTMGFVDEKEQEGVESNFQIF